MLKGYLKFAASLKALQNRTALLQSQIVQSVTGTVPNSKLYELETQEVWR